MIYNLWNILSWHSYDLKLLSFCCCVVVAAQRMRETTVVFSDNKQIWCVSGLQGSEAFLRLNAMTAKHGIDYTMCRLAPTTILWFSMESNSLQAGRAILLYANYLYLPYITLFFVCISYFRLPLSLKIQFWNEVRGIEQCQSNFPSWFWCLAKLFCLSLASHVSRHVTSLILAVTNVVLTPAQIGFLLFDPCCIHNYYWQQTNNKKIFDIVS